MARTASMSISGWHRVGRRGGELLQATTRQLLPALGIALIVASVLFCLALLTYYAGDPSLDAAGAAPPRNYLRPSGAGGAGLLLPDFGVAALLFPAGAFCWGLWALLRQPDRPPPP